MSKILKTFRKGTNSAIATLAPKSVSGTNDSVILKYYDENGKECKHYENWMREVADEAKVWCENKELFLWSY